MTRTFKSSHKVYWAGGGRGWVAPRISRWGGRVYALLEGGGVHTVKTLKFEKGGGA